MMKSIQKKADRFIRIPVMYGITRFRPVRTGILAFILPLLLVCISKDENPYLDITKAGVFVEPAYFYPKDTIAIFQTFSFTINTRLPDFIDHIVIYAQNNRLWAHAETTITMEPLLSSTPPIYSVSFSDTGLNTIYLKAFLTNGDVITYPNPPRKIVAYSPLHQDDITTTLGSRIQLTTPPVPDKVDYYIWMLSTDTRPIISETCSTSLETKNLAPFSTGELYVKAGSTISPPVPFTLSLRDATAPQINCTNDNVRSDTLRTGDYFLTARFEITDIGGTVAEPTINGTRFDRSASGLYSKDLKRLDTLTQPLQLVVRASDEFNNASCDTLWVVFSDTTVPTEFTTLQFLTPARDSTSTRSTQFNVTGSTANNSKYDSLYVFLSVNGANAPGYKVVTPANTLWDWNIAVSQPVNKLCAAAFVTPVSTDTIASARITLLYDPGVVDQAGPVIQVIAIDGVTAGNSFYSVKSSVAIQATVNDEGSGVKDVLLGAVPMQRTGLTSQYSGTMILQHSKTGNLITVTAHDNAVPANTSNRTITGYFNQYPYVSSIPQFAFVHAGELYSIPITVKDPDNDPVSVAVSIHSRSRDTVVSIPSGTLSWTPSARDTGIVNITIQMADGYQNRDTSYQIAVLPNVPIPPDTALFTITENNFPDTLFVGRDTLGIVLSINKPFDKQYYFSAMIVRNGVYLLNNSTSNKLVWKPTIADTGSQRLLITVKSQAYTDSLTPVILVRRIPPILLSFRKPAILHPETAPRCSVAVRLGSFPSQMVYGDVYLNKSKTTADTSEYKILSPTRLFYYPADTVKYVILGITNDTLVEANKTIDLLLDAGPSGLLYTTTAGSECLVTIASEDTLKQPDSLYVNFAQTTFTTPERACTVQVPVKLSRKAPSSVNVTFANSGTAVQNADYSLLSSNVTFMTGDSIKNAGIRIINDTVCEKTQEQIHLIIRSVQGGFRGKDSIATITIDTSDPGNCRKSVVVVTGGGTSYSNDKSIIDTLTNMGYIVNMVRETQVATIGTYQPDLIFISASVLPNSIGSQLKTWNTPVMCGSGMNFINLGLSTTATARVYSGSTALIRQYNASWIPGPFTGPYKLTRQVETFTSITYTGRGTVMACSNSDTTAALILSFNQGQILGDGVTAAPARRIAFCMAEYGTHSEPEYQEAWWIIFKQNVQWALH